MYPPQGGSIVRDVAADARCVTPQNDVCFIKYYDILDERISSVHVSNTAACFDMNNFTNQNVQYIYDIMI